jgi:hypothetical protein
LQNETTIANAKKQAELKSTEEAAEKAEKDRQQALVDVDTAHTFTPKVEGSLSLEETIDKL